jgi:hypothetical protein
VPVLAAQSYGGRCVRLSQAANHGHILSTCLPDPSIGPSHSSYACTKPVLRKWQVGAKLQHNEIQITYLPRNPDGFLFPYLSTYCRELLVRRPLEDRAVQVKLARPSVKERKKERKRKERKEGCTHARKKCRSSTKHMCSVSKLHRPIYYSELPTYLPTAYYFMLFGATARQRLTQTPVA